MVQFQITRIHIHACIQPLLQLLFCITKNRHVAKKMHCTNCAAKKMHKLDWTDCCTAKQMNLMSDESDIWGLLQIWSLANRRCRCIFFHAVIKGRRSDSRPLPELHDRTGRESWQLLPLFQRNSAALGSLHIQFHGLEFLRQPPFFTSTVS